MKPSGRQTQTLQYEVHIEVSSRECNMERERKPKKKRLYNEKPDKHSLESDDQREHQYPQVTATADDALDAMWWEWDFTSVVLLPQTQYSSLTMRKTSDKSRLSSKTRKSEKLSQPRWAQGDSHYMYCGTQEGILDVTKDIRQNWRNLDQVWSFG